MPNQGDPGAETPQAPPPLNKVGDHSGPVEQFFRPKPATVLAVHWDGSHDQAGEILEWVADRDGVAVFREANETRGYAAGEGYKPHIQVTTKDNGLDYAVEGDWILRDEFGHFFTVNHDDFEQIYEAIGSPPVG